MKLSFRAALSAATLLSLAACAEPAQTAKPAGVAEVDRALGDGGVSDFYTPPAQVPATVGQMIRTQPITDRPLPENAGQAVRTLYTSISGVNAPDPVTVSGQIIFPKGTPPKGGWPVVAWEHGTTGIADICAPSWRGYHSRDRAYPDH